MIRTKYLVRSNREENTLIMVSGKEWYQIVTENKKLPEDQHRYFIRDVIIDNENSDRLIIEGSKEEYKAWRHDEQVARRNREYAQKYDFLPFDAPLEKIQDLFLSETLSDSMSAEDTFFANHVMEEILSSLDKWKPWATNLLQLYLKGERRSSTKWLAKHCEVSEQTARRYKREFERVLRELLHEIFN